MYRISRGNHPVNPDRNENNRNMSRYKPEGWLILLVAAFLLTCLVVGVIHTLYSFKPNAEAILARQAAMQDEIRQLQSEQADMRRAVDAWTGVTEK